VATPTRHITVTTTISGPPAVRRGSTLVYYVTLKNTSQMSYLLDPCPDYNEFLGAKQVWASFQLNCRPVRKISPGANAVFEMHLVIPSTFPIGASELTWALLDGRLTIPVAHASISVTN